jgi:hypothetical protein
MIAPTDPGFEKKIEEQIEARLRDIETERAKWTRILALMRSQDAPRASQGLPPVAGNTPNESKLNPEPVTNSRLIVEAIQTIKSRPEPFVLQDVVQAIRTLSFPEAQRITRQQIRNAFRKLAIKKNSPLKKVGSGKTGDQFLWRNGNDKSKEEHLL